MVIPEDKPFKPLSKKQNQMSNTNNFPPYVMRILRQRRRLDEDDESEDAQINALTPEFAVKEICGWEFGDPRWANRFAGWIIDCKASVKNL